METEICVDDAVFKEDHDTIMLERENGFFSLANCIYGGGVGVIRSILNHNASKNSHDILKNFDGYLEGLLEDKNVLKPAAVMMTTTDINKSAIVTCGDVTVIVTVDMLNPKASPKAKGEDIYKGLNKIKKRVTGSVNTIVLLNDKLSYNTLLDLFMIATEAKTAALCDLDLKGSYSGDIAIDIGKDSTIIACVGKEDSENVENNIQLRMLVGKCVGEATRKAIKKYGFSRTILEFTEDLGVEIQDLVDAGMELCVGVDITDDLCIKLEKEILKALKDINVVSFIVAGARLEEDYTKKRINGINIDDDPAFLYADEVIGMAIANQIAGTKAIFNFKIYDEVKPGIIAELGPILDDVFAGIVAGCMSKIFEE